MGKREAESMCQRAILYYYDYLSGFKGNIPEEIFLHIEKCIFCRQEVQWLRQADAQSSSAVEYDTIATVQAEHLRLHFALTDQPIGCSVIKDFLPVLAIPGQQVTIPTPVTTHIDHCPSCAQDLETLKQLNLTILQYGQVCRIFSEDSIQDYHGFSEHQIDTIHGILNRPNSKVVTRFRFREDVVGIPACKPYDVEVWGDPSLHADTFKKQSGEATPTAAPCDSIVHAPAGFRRWHRPIAAAAAVLLVGILLLFRNPSVLATDISQIYEALKHVQNIEMTHYEFDSPTPLQQTWISRPMRIKLFKTKNTLTLWDLNHEIQRFGDSDMSARRSVPLDKAMNEMVSKTMNVPWGLLPFKNTDELPAGAVWERVQTDGFDEEQMEIYDLFWSERSMAGETIHYHWRYHLDVATKHPLQVQSWIKSQSDQEYEPVIVIEISYPTMDQIKAVLDQFGF